ncbi:protein of unknown function [Methylococcus capsulatus]|uniref:Uncharacterized protein n=1 Tax=Methylococcus capsulatus TaxID=414 RepID=A0AA35XUI5_METCP|nr:protein of unknown function [Methylococcus capsulatus]
MPFSHCYPFDPTYGFSLDQLLRVEPPDPPEDFAAFWSARYDDADPPEEAGADGAIDLEATHAVEQDPDRVARHRGPPRRPTEDRAWRH